MHPNCTSVCAPPHVYELVLTNLLICKDVAPIVVSVLDYLQKARLIIILDNKKSKVAQSSAVPKEIVSTSAFICAGARICAGACTFASARTCADARTCVGAHT